MTFQRNTRQRRVILEELRKLTSHPTAVELHDIVQRSLPRISLGTVYRNLELLTQMGVIQKLEVSGSEARFDGNPAQHCHVRCVRCGRVDDLHEVPDHPVKGEFREADGYEILDCRLAFTGVCPRCRRRRNEHAEPENPGCF